jgi:hypothetical protein
MKGFNDDWDEHNAKTAVENWITQQYNLLLEFPDELMEGVLDPYGHAPCNLMAYVVDKCKKARVYEISRTESNANRGEIAIKYRLQQV